MDKANGGFSQCVIVSFIVMLMGLMVTTGCGNKCEEAPQANVGVAQKPGDLHTLFETNICVSCDLSNWHLDRMDLSHTDLTNANLTNTTFLHSHMIYANLQNANLSGANLSNANLSSSNLSNANLQNANLTGTILAYSNLSGAKLDGAIMNHTDLIGAIWIDGSECNRFSRYGQCEPQ